MTSELTPQWRKSSDELPEGFGKVWVFRDSTRGGGLLTVVSAHIVRKNSMPYPYWMPMETPEPPQKEAHDV